MFIFPPVSNDYQDGIWGRRKELYNILHCKASLEPGSASSLCCENEISEVQVFVSLSNFFMSTCTFEGRHWMAKAKCHSSITDLRGNFSPANSRCKDFMPAIFVTSVQNCRCPSGWLFSRKWNLVSQEVLRLGAA